MARRSFVLGFVAGARSFVGAPAVVLALAAGASAGCAHDPPAAAPSTPVARRPVPARTSEPAVAARDPARSVELPAVSPGAAPAIFFDFDSAVLRDEARPALERVAGELRARRQARLRVEGNCDQLGTVEYNLALGEHRAEAAKQFLVQLGVPTGRIATVSYGSQRPKYEGANEEARAKNRRDDLVIQ